MNLELKIKEFTKNGGLEKYESFVERILCLIYEHGCSISARYDGEIRSSHSKDDSKCHIRIPLIKQLYPHNEYLIWITLHELGHHFQNNTKQDLLNKQKLIKIETDAWRFAESKFFEMSFPSELYSSFVECKEYYLNSYK